MLDLYHEIFDKLQTLNTREEKIQLLRKNSTIQFKDFLRGLFDPNIKFDVEIPEYRPSIEPAGLNYSSLHTEMNRAYIFVIGHPKSPTGLTAQKKMAILKNMLESVHKNEAELLIGMLKKNLKIKSLTPKLVNEAFPDINVG